MSAPSRSQVTLVARLRQEILDSRRNGLLQTTRRIVVALQDRICAMPGCWRLRPVFEWATSAIERLRRHINASFDRRYGTDTHTSVSLADLDLGRADTTHRIWYQAMPAGVFRQIMEQLPIEHRRWSFIDFGSGKGRVLLLASAYPFQRIIGVEFAEQLNRIARANFEIFARKAGRRLDNIETVCIDATVYRIPDGPVVAFFFSPFTEDVLERVLQNLVGRDNAAPGETVLIFYGNNPGSIERFKATGLAWRELRLRPDWGEKRMYRAFVFGSHHPCS